MVKRFAQNARCGAMPCAVVDKSASLDRARLQGPWALAGLALSFALLTYAPAALSADCDTDSSTYECTGDVIEYDIDATDLDDDVTTITFSDVDSSDDDATYFFWVDNTGDEGNSHGDDGDDVNGIAVTFYGSDTEIDLDGSGDYAATSLSGQGGKGHSGKDRTSDTSSGKGGDGGDGGDVSGEQALALSSGTISGTASGAASLTSSGGDGGSGGKGRSYGTSDGKGGDGGDGGAGSDATINIIEDAVVNITVDEDETPGIYVISSGGDGNDGGKGEGGTNAKGGDGGIGGAAEGASFYADDGAEVTITTSGNLSHGIEVLSRGGDGGDGGNAEGSTGDSSGGDGGDGGAAGDVVVYSEGATLTITTNETDSIGILARSYGGAGGDGGSAESTFGEGKGGSSENPGTAGDVDVYFVGTITTIGDGDSSDDDGDDYTTTSTGILAQSVGGFAGDAGDSSGTFEAYGASSQSAGDAGNVTIEIYEGSTITTNGTYSAGLEVQSIGGGGGKGGSADAIYSVGGDGSSGGNGGTVNVTLYSDDNTAITTTDTHSPAISAQSVGGGGGKSGSSSGFVTIGGTAGSGGDGGDVTVNLAATLTTTEDYSEGIFVQSTGGGGGVAHSSAGFFETIGGSGGDGGDSAIAQVIHSEGDISTSGIDSDGVDIQSVGGGGGKGASVYDIGAEFSMAVGSAGGDGGNGGSASYTEDTDVDVADYTISTEQEYSTGISVQSGGGGGGNSGSVLNVTASIGFGVTIGATEDASAGGDGSDVTVDTIADITTGGSHSDGIFAQSYGGGGGNAGTIIDVSASYDLADVTLTTGAEGGAGGDGGTVDVTSTGTITTSQDHSYGIYAQSKGGGGGKSTNTYSINGESLTSISITTGATGGDGGDGAAVTVVNEGDITTGGESSTALHAQSAGGGGGSSGTTFSFDSISVTSVSTAVGGNGGDGGSASDVSVTNSGDLTTTQDSSDGLYAQSVGGGGGNSGSTYAGTGFSAVSFSVAVGGTGGSGGDSDDDNPDTSGAVTVYNTGDVTVSGANSNGIYAESRGGSGGKSGTTVSFETASLGDVSVAVGGEGGDGGTSSAVSVENYGTIEATGDNGIGIYASSHGGEGGNSGMVVSATAITGSSASVAIGNGGGAGGTAGDTSVYNYGDVTTSQDLSYGILAQSLGGAGGNASTVVNIDALSGLTSDATDGISGNLSFSLGGDGGDGGYAGEVYVENSETITTNGDKAYGILAQSVGGNGGSGGSVYSFQLDLLTSSSINFSASVGGSGADGAAANTVTVQNDGTIETYGLYGHGIMGQSVGGSGGSGGSVIAATASTSETVDLGVSISVGGEGGDGSIGNDVAITNTGEIYANSTGGIGIYAQSIGGDGGDGGSAAAYVLDYTLAGSAGTAISVSSAIGGTGGTGNDAGAVTVTNSGTVGTYGASGDAIFAQSVGGGGGDGGSAEATSISFVDDPSDYGTLGIEVAFELGGSGGSGGDGGDVEVTNQGVISTDQDVAVGIFAQSVGGGGGTGGESGTNSSVTTDNATTWEDYAELIVGDLVDFGVSTYTTYSLYSDYSSYFTNWTVSVGGSGGAAGDGKTVTVNNESSISTTGVDSTGIYAQSVGGGGGTGGTGTSASIKTKLAMGGDGGAGGHGDTVKVTNTGDITTTGERANGIWAQSIGGGGGDAGDVEGAFGAYLDDAVNDTVDEYDSDSDFELYFSMDIGANYDGDAGNGGDGGDVTVDSTDSTISTTGESGIGVWAQSVGGGGGTAGSVSLSLYIAGSNGAEGDSGDVTVSLDNSAIETTGDYSVGIFAQSSSGSYETSDVSDLDTYFSYDGDSSYDAGDVSIDLTDGASISVSGTDSRAVIAASSGYDTAGQVSITLDDDSSISGSGGNANVIMIYDGNSNEISNSGTIEDGDFTDTSRTDSVYAIRTKITSDEYDSYGSDGNADLTVSNYGTISGSVKFTSNSSNSVFTNYDAGTFNSGSVVDLGDGGDLYNYGTLSPGGSDEIFTTTISDGDFYQEDTGSLLVDLEMNTASGDEEADLIIADTVKLLDGSIEVNATGTNDVSDGDSGYVYILVTDSLSDEDLSVSDSSIVDYEIEIISDDDVTVDDTTYSDTNAVKLSYTIDVGSSDASINASELSSYVSDDDDTDTDSDSDSDDSSDSSVTTTSSSLVALVATATTATADGDDLTVEDGKRALFSELMNASTGEDLDTVAAEHVVDETGAALYAARQTSQTVHSYLRSCPTFDRADPRGFMHERDCGWIGLVGSENTYDNDAGGTSFNEQAYGLAAGGQRVLDNGFVLGGIARGEDVTLSGTNFEQDGGRYTLGVVLKYQDGPLTYSLSTAYALQDLDQSRSYSLNGTTYTASSDVKSDVVSADARLTYLQDFSKNYLRWGIGLGLYYAHQDGFSESGNGPLNWTIQSTNKTDAVVRPTLEFGRTLGPNNDQGRFFVSAGVVASLTDPNITVYGDLNGTNSNTPMAHVFNYDRFAAQFGVGFDFEHSDNMRLSLRGNGLVSENARAGDFSASLRWLF